MPPEKGAMAGEAAIFAERAGDMSPEKEREREGACVCVCVCVCV